MKSATLVMSAVMFAIGVAILVRTIAGGGGALASGLLVGVLFCAAGAGRFIVERRRP